MLARRLLPAGGGGFTTPTARIRGIVRAGPPAADAYGYNLRDDVNDTMDTAHVIDDGAGAYVAVYHVWRGGASVFFDTYLATSSDLITWTRRVQLGLKADIPQIGRRADGSFVVGWEDEDTPHRLKFRRYTNLANLLTGTYASEVRLAQTLASGGGAEGTPNFFTVEEPMDIGFHYNDGTRDKLGRGTLASIGGSWTAAADSVPDGLLAAAGVNARGEQTTVTWRGHTVRYAEGQYTVGDFTSFRIWFVDSGSVELETITTHGGSTAAANITCSILEHPSAAGQILFVALYQHSGGAAPGEAGPMYYWTALP